MKKTFKTFLLPLFMAAAIWGTGCKKDDDTPPTPTGKTITQTVVDNADFSLLRAALVRAGLDDDLGGTGPFTVFAPTNAAFNAAGFANVDAINAAPQATLINILQYHVLTGKVESGSVPAGPNAEVTTLGGGKVYATRGAAGVFINGVKVATADLPATNGVIHVIGSVLMPPSGNIVQTAQGNPNLTYLVAAVLRASTGTTNVANVLAGAGPLTVFAPTNAAFIAAGFPTIDAINAAIPNDLTTILTYHVVAGRVFSSDLTEGAQPTTVNGEKVTITLAGGAKVKGTTNTTAANIAITNIVTTNGVVHVIDQVLLPTPMSKTITQYVVDNPAFSLLKAAVVRAGLDDDLATAGPFTVFAPTNAAFNAAGFANEAAINAAPVATLESILKYHVLSGKITAADVPAGPNAEVTTLNTAKAYVTKNASGVYINGVKVATADVAVSNGVIHAIGKVLMPPTGNIVQTAQGNPNLTFLVAAVLRASTGATNVAGVLSGAGPLTVFAPTNAAFQAAGFATIDAINAADPATLTSILTYHVVAARVFSSDLTEGAQPTTVNGGKVTITLAGGAKVKGNGNPAASNIAITDIVTTNGVVHVIDGVLLP